MLNLSQIVNFYDILQGSSIHKLQNDFDRALVKISSIQSYNEITFESIKFLLNLVV